MCSGKRVLLAICCLAAVVVVVRSEIKLLLLHTNDMHARFEETNAYSGQCVKGKCYGGFARLKTAVEHFRKEAEAEGRSSIFLNAGDTYQGTPFYTIFKWKIVSELVNMLGIDAMSLGNHEFDDGPEGLAPFIANSMVPIVSCNMDYSGEPALNNPNLTKLVSSTVLDVEGVKVGVIGYLTPETKFLSQTGKVALLDEVSEITKEVVRLKDDGINILIALGHSGYTRDRYIAEMVPDLDVVVGGHTNTFLYNGKAPDSEVPEGPYPTIVTQSAGRKVLVVQAYAYTKYLGYLKLTFNSDGEIDESEGNPVLIDQSFKKNGSVERAVLVYSNQLKETTGRKVGSSKSFLEADYATCRLRECNFGNFVTDAMVDMNGKDFSGKGWTNAPVAFIQGGSLRASVDPSLTEGAIRYVDLLTALPFLNSVELLVVKGGTLIKVLEHSVARYSVEDKRGEFLQFSGIQVVYDLSKPPHQRVVTAKVRCGDCHVPQYHPLDEDLKYRVMTTSFLANGGDSYTMLMEITDRKTLSFSDLDATEQYLSRTSPVNPEISGRIQFLQHLLQRNNATPNICSSGQILFISIFILTIFKFKVLQCL